MNLHPNISQLNLLDIQCTDHLQQPSLVIFSTFLPIRILNISKYRALLGEDNKKQTKHSTRTKGYQPVLYILYMCLFVSLADILKL